MLATVPAAPINWLSEAWETNGTAPIFAASPVAPVLSVPVTARVSALSVDFVMRKRAE